jgi:hypothetical protein
VTLHDTDASQAANVTLRLVSDRVEEVTQLLAEVNQEIRGEKFLDSQAAETLNAPNLPVVWTNLNLTER